MAFDKIKYDNDFVKEHYDRIEFTVPKGKRKELQAHAQQRGKKVAELIVEALEKDTGLDLSK